MKEYRARIINGTLNSPELAADLCKAEGIEVLVTIEVYNADPKTTEQGGYLWTGVYDTAVSFYSDNIGAFIRDLMLATKAKITKAFVHELFKMMFNGGKSTKRMEKDKMAKYIDKILHHFLHEHQVLIEEPKK